MKTLPAATCALLGALAVAASPARAQTACGLGTVPAVFDDFDYASRSAEPRVAGGVFGASDWARCAGRRRVSERSRSWYRFNHEEPGVNPDSRHALAGSGAASRLVLTMAAGFRHDPEHGRNTHHPMVRSGFAARTGTWAARVRFEDQSRVGIPVTAAFWTQEDQPLQEAGGHNSELDFEWTNWMQHPGHRPGPSSLDVAVHGYAGRGVNTNPRPFDCEGPAVARAAACRDGRGRSLIARADRRPWWTLVVTFDGRSARFSALSDAGVRAGGGAAESPVVIRERVPGAPMNAQFGVLTFVTPPPGGTRAPHTLDVDWFYYSPETDLDLAAVGREVAALRRAGARRVNTAGLDLRGKPDR